MDIITNRIKMYHRGIRRTLLGTFIMNLVSTSILLMFALGLKDVTNETLSKSDLEQMMVIFTSVVLVAILCICFLQWIISVEIRALFKSREQFNINMRLMGLSGKKLGKIYQKELLNMQYIVVPSGIILTQIIYAIISLKATLPWIGIDKIILATIIHLTCVILSLKFILRKLVSFEVTHLIRGQVENTAKPIGKVSKILAAIGTFILVVTWILDTFFKFVDLEFFYIIGILLIVAVLFHKISKLIIQMADTIGTSYISFSERIHLGKYKKNKNMIIMLGIGLMFFLGLQTLYMSARYITREVGLANIQYQCYLLYDEPIQENKLADIENSEQSLFGLNYKFFIKESDYAKYLYGIEEEFLDFETIQLDESLSKINLKEKLLNPNWNGILLPNGMISSDNIGDEYIVNINGKQIPFIIEGGYYQNTYHKGIWFVNKSYLQQQLDLEGYSNAVYLKEKNNNIIAKFAKLGTIQEEYKEDIIQKSVKKVVQSTEVVEITSFIVILCAIISIISYIILSSNENIKDIAQFRSAGMGIVKTRIIYLNGLISMVLKGFALGIVLAILFGKTSLYTVFAGRNTNMALQYPVVITIFLFIVISIVISITFLLSTRRGFQKDFTLILRKNEN